MGSLLRAVLVFAVGIAAHIFAYKAVFLCCCLFHRDDKFLRRSSFCAQTTFLGYELGFIVAAGSPVDNSVSPDHVHGIRTDRLHLCRHVDRLGSPKQRDGATLELLKLLRFSFWNHDEQIFDSKRGSEKNVLKNFARLPNSSKWFEAVRARPALKCPFFCQCAQTKLRSRFVETPSPKQTK